MALDEHFILWVELLRDKIKDESKYPFSLCCIQALEEITFNKNITFLVGENGTWKSTLLEAIAIAYWLNPEWWSKNTHFLTQETHSSLWEHLRLSKWYRQPKDSYFLRAESFYNVSSNLDEMQKEDPRALDAYGGKSLHEQSHWESFFTLFMERFWANWIYILDEPEAALSPQKQIAFLVRLQELIDQWSQFIIATHSPILLAYPKAKIFEITKSWYTTAKYDDLESVSLYRDFLNNHEYMCKRMLS